MSITRDLFSGFFRGLGWSLSLFLVPAVVAIVIFSFVEKDEGVDSVSGDSLIRVVDLDGEIMESEKFRRALERAVKNPEVKGIVVRIDSPGGAVGASEEINDLIESADKKKPVICSLQTVAASGGLFSAVGCRKIVTHAGTLTGSIGVIMMTPQVPLLLEKYGVGMNVIKSGQYKDVGSPFRAMTDGDRTYLQQIINGAYETFVRAISEGRGLPVEEVKRFADGRIILGEEAVRLKLADEIGGVERAAQIALQEAGGEGEPEIAYPTKKTGLQQLLDPEAWSWVQLFTGIRESRLLYQAFP